MDWRKRKLLFVRLSVYVNFSTELFHFVAPPFSIYEPPLLLMALRRHDVVELWACTFMHLEFSPLRCPDGGLVFI